jgi:hypothetical protein
MIIDLSAVRNKVKDKYDEVVFYSKIDNSPQLNSFVFPIIFACLISEGNVEKAGTSSTIDALIFGGCEVLKQINSYFILYKK